MGKLTRTILVAAFALAATLAIAPAAFASTIYLDDYDSVDIANPEDYTMSYRSSFIGFLYDPILLINGDYIQSSDPYGTERWTWEIGEAWTNSSGNPMLSIYAYPTGNADYYGDVYTTGYGEYAEFDIPLTASALTDFDDIIVSNAKIVPSGFKPTVTAKVVYTNAEKVAKQNVTKFCTLKYYTTENNAVGNINGKTTVTKPGTYWVKITGKGPLKGTMVKKITVKKEVTVKVDNRNFMYDGKYHKPVVRVYYGTKKLTKDVSYTIVSNKSHKKSGTYTITLKGKGNYAGCTFTGTQWKIWPKKTFGSSTAAWGKELTVGKDLPSGIYRFKATEGKIGKICIHNNDIQLYYEHNYDDYAYKTETLSFGKLYYVKLFDGDKIKSCNARYTRINFATYSLKSTVYTTKNVAMYRVGKDLKAGTYRLTGAKSGGKGTYEVAKTLGDYGSSYGDLDFATLIDPFTHYHAVNYGSLSYGKTKTVTLKSGQYLVVQNVKAKKI